METEFLEGVFNFINNSSLSVPLWYPMTEESNEENRLAQDEFIIIKVLPIPPENYGICSNRTINQWILSLLIYSKRGRGQLKTSAIIDSIREVFPANTDIETDNYTFRVFGGLSASPYFGTETHYVTPVRISIKTIKTVET